MGAGISKERERKIKYNNLTAYARQLTKAGIPAHYDAKQKAVVPDVGEGFAIGYGQTLRASNGEAFGVLAVKIVHPQTAKVEHYSLVFDSNKIIERVKLLFGPNADPVKLAESDLFVLVNEIDRIIRVNHDRANKEERAARNALAAIPKIGTFLHDENGNRVATNDGECHFYPKALNGSPYVRLGSTEYVEVKPGYTLRDEKGNVLLTR